MSEQWIVVLTESRGNFAYGPTEDKDTAEAFAEFLTREVDPAAALQLRSPTAELLAWWRQSRSAHVAEPPEHWPPMPGSVWSDKVGDRWVCVPAFGGKPYLMCLIRPADDSADEILRRFGPLELAQIVPIADEEVPF